MLQSTKIRLTNRDSPGFMASQVLNLDMKLGVITEFEKLKCCPMDLCGGFGGGGESDLMGKCKLSMTL